VAEGEHDEGIMKSARRPAPTTTRISWSFKEAGVDIEQNGPFRPDVGILRSARQAA
jgi:hypothetical protein